jgi:hypothetical protein
VKINHDASQSSEDTEDFGAIDQSFGCIFRDAARMHAQDRRRKMAVEATSDVV